MHKIDRAGVKLTAGWESFVPWPYDDMAKPVITAWHGIKIKAPPRWHQGQPVRGTLTAGFGHTDAGKHPLKIMELVQSGRELSKDEAYDILAIDMDDAGATVNRLVKMPLTQGQFDALVDLVVNMGGANFKKSSLLAKLNRGDYAGARAAFDLYVNSKGQRITGLVRRRDAEQVMWDAHEAEHEAPAPHTPHEDEDFETTPKDVEGPPPPKTMAQSNIGNAQIGTVATTVATAGAAVVDKATDDAPAAAAGGAVDQIGALIERGSQAAELVDKARDLAPAAKPLWKVAVGFLASPEVLAIAVFVIVIVCGFAWWERRRHLREDGV